MNPSTTNTAARELLADGDILQVLRDVEEYLTDCADVVDGDYGQLAPNREMTLLVAVQAELARLTK